MPTQKLTTRLIKAANYDGRGYDGRGASRHVLWDREVTGLGLRLFPGGRKSFVLSYRTDGRKRLMTIGKFGVLTLDQARAKARKHLVGVGDGFDPLLARQKAAEERTFEDLVGRYLTDHAIGPRGTGDPRKKTWSTDQGRLVRHTPPAWRRRKVKSITLDDVAAVHAAIGATRPYEANRFLDLLRVMFRLARLWRMVPEGRDNPADGVEKFKEQKRKRWLTPEELPRLAQAIDNEPNVYVRTALWLYLLTGVRKGELLRARWEDIDFERGFLRLPETKSGEEQTVALSSPALAILQSVPRLEDNPHILPGAKKGRHLVNIDKPWRRIRKAAGVNDVRLHDLRRTVGSWLTQAGVDLNIIKDALRHSNISTTLIYTRLGENPAREAMEAHGKRILEAAGKSGPVEVVRGGPRKA